MKLKKDHIKQMNVSEEACLRLGKILDIPSPECLLNRHVLNMVNMMLHENMTIIVFTKTRQIVSCSNGQ